MSRARLHLDRDSGKEKRRQREQTEVGGDELKDQTREKEEGRNSFCLSIKVQRSGNPRPQ